VRLSHGRALLTAALTAAFLTGAAMPAYAASDASRATPKKAITWLTPAQYERQLATQQTGATSGPATTAATIFCTLDPEEPYYYRGDVTGTGQARCTAIPDAWNGKLILWAYYNGRYTGVAQDVSNTPPNQWTGHDYVHNYAATAVCTHNVPYHTNMEADGSYGNWAHYSANSNTLRVC
jgi:hypothetical protein